MANPLSHLELPDGTVLDLTGGGSSFDYTIIVDEFDTSGGVVPNTYAANWIVFRAWNDPSPDPGGVGPYHEAYFQNTSGSSVTSDIPPEEDSTHWTTFTNYVDCSSGSGAMVDANGYVLNMDGTMWQNENSWSSWFSPFPPGGTAPSGFDAAGGESWSAGTASYHQYAVGDYVIKDEKLYRCTSATTGQSWVSSKWTEVQVMDEVVSKYNTLNTALTTFANNNKRNIWYGTCSTAAATQQKSVSVTGSGFTLTNGNMLIVKFTNANTYNGTATMKVGSLTAKNIYSTNSSSTTNSYWAAGEVVAFIYDGSKFIMVGKAIASTSSYGPTKLNSATDSTSETEAATPKAVKAAYDMAAAGGYTVTFTTTGSLVANAQFTSSDGELSTCPASITLVTSDTDSTYKLYPIFFTDSMIPTINGIISDGSSFYKASFVYSSGKYALMSMTQF